MKKNFIICGCPLAWKSTLSNLLSQKFKIFHIPTDAFITAFQENFPLIWINHNWTFENISKIFYPFFKSFVLELDSQNIYGWYLIEWFHIDIEKAFLDFWKTHEIIVIWYPNISIKEKFDLVREFDKNNWTNDLDDESLVNHIISFINISKNFKSICDKYNINFLDTSFDRNLNIENIVKKYIN